MSNKFESSMTDLMISLVVIFLLVIAFIVLQFNKAQKAPMQKIDTLVNILKTELDAKTKSLHIPGLLIEKKQDDPLGLEIQVAESNLKFNYNSAELNSQNKQFLMAIMPSIVDVLRKHESDIDFIKVEGYTDQSGGNSGMGNIILSQNRALSVLNYSLQNIFMTANDPNRIFLLDKASISGYGSLNKYLLKTDEQSRRVVIKVRVKSLELYKKVKENK
jgi:outer membrane protein OmpA-like peptidoglycan-associated protein